MLKKGCVKSEYNSSVYFKVLENNSIIFLEHCADDMLIAAKSMFDIDILKR